jgi:hypothetical protein
MVLCSNTNIEESPMVVDSTALFCCLSTPEKSAPAGRSKKTGLYVIDSHPLKVCRNKRIS